MADEVNEIVPVESGVAEAGEAVPAVKSLFNKNFVLLLNGQFISRLGAQISSMVMLLWIKETTGSASLMGLMSMLTGITVVALGIVGGTSADRYSRRNIISWSDGASGVGMLILAALFFWMPENVTLLAVAIIAVSVFAAIADSFSSPAITAAIPDLVPAGELHKANSLTRLAITLTTILGQGLGGVFFRSIGMMIVALINGITFLIAAFTEAVITIPQKMPEKVETWREHFNEFKKDTLFGLRFVWHSRGLRRLLLVSSLLGFFFSPVIILIPFYVSDYLRVAVDWVGYLSAAYGIGAIIGYVSAYVKQIAGRRRSLLMIAMMILQPVCIILLVTARVPWLALGYVIVAGALSGFVEVYLVSVIQSTTSSENRGRIFGVLGTISASLAPLGMAVGGVVFDGIGQNIVLMFLGCGIIMTVMILAVSINRDLVDYLATEIITEPDAAELESAASVPLRPAE